ncbi:hypothetical protein ARMGADRAFT_1043979 [Armillaria gallica]|uniref:Peptidase S53 domain-containing protein n=1 Tax=Armillaria gallica TaxID=47427 RepID=A0A2H3E9K3_ARMGA|nr:hypothetical protein ARMGADRAFT_1043979 [Armillaria gallica]
MFRVISLSVALITISSMWHDAAPNDFVGVGAADLQASLNFHIGLMPKDTAGLKKALYTVSEPDSDIYGQHLSFEEVKAFSAPTPEAATAVTAWLAENGITDVKLGGTFDDWLTFVASVGKANTLLSAQYESFMHIDTGELLIHTLTASIPSDLAEFIEVVHPTTSFARLMFAPSSCNNVITPVCLQALYGIPATPATQSSNKLAVSGFLDQYAQTIDGGLNIQGKNEAGIETNLDIQHTVGVATGVPTIFISVGNSTTDGFLDIINALNTEPNPPQVLTTSYAFDETNILPNIAICLCNAYAALGNGGVSGNQAKTCMTFIPTFPAGCLYITSVGVIQGITETAASLSTGGFSNIFAPLSYQASAVSIYLITLGFPDVTVQGNDVLIVSGGEGYLVAGTSCSSPIFASVISLINDCLIAAGKLVLSFLNPFLYVNPNVFFDITMGSNPGCEFPFSSVTSLGTPNFAALLKAAGL